jgi:hypothetical protein
MFISALSSDIILEGVKTLFYGRLLEEAYLSVRGNFK